MKLTKISPRFIVIDYSVYVVIDYDEGIKKGFKKGNAYEVRTDFIDIVLPFRGILKEIDPEKRLPGIYTAKKNQQTHRFLLPKGKDAQQYSPDEIRLTNSDIFSKGNFVKGDIIIDSDGELFKPRVKSDDDLNLKLFKIAFCLKDASLASYDNRFQGIDIGTNPSNRKSNAKKAIQNNNTLSSTKLIQLGDVVDLDFAVVVKDKPGAMYPMNTNGKPLVVYSGSIFSLNDAINVSSLDLDKVYATQEDKEEE